VPCLREQCSCRSGSSRRGTDWRGSSRPGTRSGGCDANTSSRSRTRRSPRTWDCKCREYMGQPTSQWVTESNVVVEEFGGKYRNHLQGKKQTKKETNRNRRHAQSASRFCWFLRWLLFDPEDGGDMFLRNVGPSPNYTAKLFIPTAARSPKLEYSSS
jgi:hypothetical protein